MDYKSLRTQKELITMRENARSDWRSDLQEEHPYVDVMPAPDQQKKDAKKKLAKKAIDSEVKEEMSIKDQMAMARESGKKRNPSPDHRDIRGKMLAKAAKKKDNRTDAEQMADATGPRKGSNFRGD
jgi:hypothetical protein